MHSHYLIPLNSPGNIIELGDIRLFRNDGLAVLGNACFERFAKIRDHEFCGCVANRNESGVLVIKTPIDTFEYEYKAALETWYQRVPNLSTDSTPFLVGHIREALGDYGIIGGPILLFIEAFCCLLGVYFKLSCAALVIFVVGVVLFLIVRTLLYFLFGIDTGTKVNPFS